MHGKNSPQHKRPEFGRGNHFPLSDRGEHFMEFRKNPWGKVCLFWDLGKSWMKLNSARVVAICPGKC